MFSVKSNPVTLGFGKRVAQARVHAVTDARTTEEILRAALRAPKANRRDELTNGGEETISAFRGRVHAVGNDVSSYERLPSVARYQ